LGKDRAERGSGPGLGRRWSLLGQGQGHGQAGPGQAGAGQAGAGPTAGNPLKLSLFVLVFVTSPAGLKIEFVCVSVCYLLGRLKIEFVCVSVCYLLGRPGRTPGGNKH
jgi:hypothetical protein